MAIPPHPVFADMNRAIVDALGFDCTVALPSGTVTVKVKARAPSGTLFADGGAGQPGATGRLTDAVFVESDVPGLADGAIVTIGGANWVVRSPLPDGRGKVRCDLEAA